MLSQNIQSIEIPLSSAPGRVYFPTDSPLNGLFINSLEFYYSYGDADMSRVTPQGAQMIDIIDNVKCLISLTSTSGKEIVKNLSMFCASFDVIQPTAFVLRVNSKLDLSKSYITVTKPITGGQSLFLLAHYSTHDNRPVIGKMNAAQITVPVVEGRNLFGQQSKLTGKKIVRVEAVNGDYNTYITLINKDNRIINNVPSQRLFQMPNNQILWLEPLSSIDWEQSYIDVIHSDEHYNPANITFNIYYL